MRSMRWGLLLAAAATAPLHGQVPAQPPAPAPMPAPTPAPAAGRTRAGIGVGLNSLVGATSTSIIVIPAALGTITVPIVTPTGMRFEPELSYFHTSSSSSSGSGGSSSSSTVFQVGVSMAGFLRQAGAMRAYAGPRAGLQHLSSDQSTTGAFPSSNSFSQTNWFFGGVLGAEYLFADGFSLGGEGQLTYTHLGDPSTTPPSGSSSSGSVVSTSALIAVRWYF